MSGTFLSKSVSRSLAFMNSCIDRVGLSHMHLRRRGGARFTKIAVSFFFFCFFLLLGLWSPKSWAARHDTSLYSR